MAHPRQEIRHAVAAQLTGKTAAGGRVFRTRKVPYQGVELPALAVYTLEESVEDDGDSAPRELQRSIQLAVEGVVEGTEDVDDALDALALEVETALHADDTFGGKASDSMLSSTELDVFEDGERTVGLVRLVYAVTYYSTAPEAVALPDFTTADIRHNLSNAVHPDNEARDNLTLEE